MRITATFFRSDSMIQDFGDTPVVTVAGPPEGFQLTYEELRRCDTGEPIATCTRNSHWSHLGVAYSDVTLSITDLA